MGGRLEEAVEHYRRSIAIHPTAEAHTFLGWALSFLGHPDEAIAECRTAIEVDPAFGNPYNDIGAYLIELGREAEAITWLERAKHAARYEPRHYPYFNLARVYVRQHKVHEAIRELQQAIAIEPRYTRRPSGAAPVARPAQLSALPLPFYDNPILFGRAGTPRPHRVRVGGRRGARLVAGRGGADRRAASPFGHFSCCPIRTSSRGFNGDVQVVPLEARACTAGSRNAPTGARRSGRGTMPAHVGAGGRARPMRPTASSPTPSISSCCAAARPPSSA